MFLVLVRLFVAVACAVDGPAADCGVPVMMCCQSFDDLPVVYFETPHDIPCDVDDDEISWREFHTVRNAILRACRKSGTVGPMGEAPIGHDGSKPDLKTRRAWKVENRHCEYHVVEDQMFASYRYHNIEFYPDRRRFLYPEGLRDMWMTLGQHPGWNIGISITDADQHFILIQRRRICVSGEAFKGCTTAAELCDRLEELR